MHVWAQARPLLVAAGLAVAVGACAFALLAFGLPRPQRGALAAAAAVKTLDEYRVAHTVELVDGERVEGSCFQGWFHDGRRANARGVGAVLDDGARIVGVGHRIFEFGRRDTRKLARVELGLACPRVLGDVIARRLARRRLTIASARADGRHAYVLRFATPRARVAFYVDAQSLTPLAIVVRSGRLAGQSDVEVARHDAAALGHILRILRRGGERHRYAYPA